MAAFATASSPPVAMALEQRDDGPVHGEPGAGHRELGEREGRHDPADLLKHRPVEAVPLVGVLLPVELLVRRELREQRGVEDIGLLLAVQAVGESDDGSRDDRSRLLFRLQRHACGEVVHFRKIELETVDELE
ncbi:hypothetical protein RB200_36050 [Streptomyces sp. PmtG]